MSSIEQTLSIIKPDAVERNLADKIKEKFLENKLTIKNQKKKFKFQEKKRLNFIKFIKQNLFMIDCVVIYLQDLLL